MKDLLTSPCIYANSVEEWPIKLKIFAGRLNWNPKNREVRYVYAWFIQTLGMCIVLCFVSGDFLDIFC
jgi:hypothetical protein